MSPNTPPSGTQRDNNPETSPSNMLGKPLTAHEISTMLRKHHPIPHSLVDIPKITQRTVDMIMQVKLPHDLLH